MFSPSLTKGETWHFSIQINFSEINSHVYFHFPTYILPPTQFSHNLPLLQEFNFQDNQHTLAIGGQCAVLARIQRNQIMIIGPEATKAFQPSH